MMINQKQLSATLLLVLAGLTPTGVSAITVEVAKKCNGLTAKAFPPHQVGNPAAGSAKGSAQDQRAYFKKCVDADGKVDDPGSGQSK